MSPTDMVLQPDTMKLLAELPKDVRLTRLAVKYPRIANRIAKDWLRPDLMKPYLRGLLIDERGGRQGFPPNIVAELLRISRYYETQVFPTDEPTTTKTPAWDDLH
jgi:hypothetical protein